MEELHKTSLLKLLRRSSIDWCHTYESLFSCPMKRKGLTFHNHFFVLNKIKNCLNRFKFTAKLRGRCRDFLYIPYTYIYIASPIINIPNYNDVLVTVNKPMLTHRNYPKSIVYLRVHSWYCTFYGLVQI